MDLKSLIPLGREHSPSRFVDPLIRLQREIDRLFDDVTQGWPATGRTQELMPSMDVAEIENEIEITATFKHKKNDLAREGYDPSVTGDAIYFHDRERREFVTLDQALYERIRSGQVRL